MEDINLFEAFLAAALGAIFGSYATLFAYRLPLKESCFGRYFGKKSRCPNCESIIKTRDLIPVLNWIFTLGRCRNCQTKIPRTHLFIELATTILFIICYLNFSFSENFIIYSLISVTFVILLVTDYTHKSFPNPLLIFLLILLIINRILLEQSIFGIIYSSLIGVICATAFYQIFYKKCKNIFFNQQQSFDYIKIILIASIGLLPFEFLLYFLIILINFIILLLFNMAKNNGKYVFSYIAILPLLFLLLFPFLTI
jgi:prepilin signal peptidase PulO-like enzyme (type II secretory pathway)